MAGKRGGCNSSSSTCGRRNLTILSANLQQLRLDVLHGASWAARAVPCCAVLRLLPTLRKKAPKRVEKNIYIESGFGVGDVPQLGMCVARVQGLCRVLFCVCGGVGRRPRLWLYTATALVACTGLCRAVLSSVGVWAVLPCLLWRFW